MKYVHSIIKSLILNSSNDLNLNTTSASTCTSTCTCTTNENGKIIPPQCNKFKTKIKSVNIPILQSIARYKSSTSISIPKKAFQGYSSLESVHITIIIESGADGANESGANENGNVTTISIEESAFAHCESLQSVYVHVDIEDCGDNSDSSSSGDSSSRTRSSTNSSSIRSSSVTAIEIGNAAFQGCKSLESMNIPKSVGNNGLTVSTIGEYAFDGCTSLSSMNIPESSNVTTTRTAISIGRQAFHDCKSLQSMNIPNGVLTIGFATFAGCKNH